MRPTSPTSRSAAAETSSSAASKPVLPLPRATPARSATRPHGVNVDDRSGQGLWQGVLCWRRTTAANTTVLELQSGKIYLGQHRQRPKIAGLSCQRTYVIRINGPETECRRHGRPDLHLCGRDRPMGRAHNVALTKSVRHGDPDGREHLHGGTTVQAGAARQRFDRRHHHGQQRRHLWRHRLGATVRSERPGTCSRQSPGTQNYGDLGVGRRSNFDVDLQGTRRGHGL